MNNLLQNYMGFDGRLNRQRWWISAIILGIVAIIISWIVTTALGISMMATDPTAAMANVSKLGWVGLIFAIIFAYPYLAISIKRRHDRNNNGYDVIGLIIVEILVNLINALGVGVGVLTGILGIIVLIYAIYVLVVLGFLKGTAGPNTYGADPLQG